MRPYVFINSAMSADGKISTVARKQVRISGEDDLRRVDALKANVDAVMVGVGTVLADDPKLTIKSVVLKRTRVDQGRTESPLRVVVDSRPERHRLRRFGTKCAYSDVATGPRHRVEELETKAEILVVGERKVDLAALLGV